MALFEVYVKKENTAMRINSFASTLVYIALRIWQKQITERAIHHHALHFLFLQTNLSFVESRDLFQSE